MQRPPCTAPTDPGRADAPVHLKATTPSSTLSFLLVGHLVAGCNPSAPAGPDSSSGAASAQRELALGRPSIEHARQNIPTLEALATNGPSGLRTEAVWTLGFAGGHEAAAALDRLLAAANLTPAELADTLVARALASTHDVAFASAWTNSPDTDVRHAARFVLGLTRGDDSARPQSVDGWARLLEHGGSAARGRRIFRSPQAGCAKCHVAEERGLAFGPAFTATNPPPARTALVTAIVEPSASIAPGFQTFLVETSDGASHVGMNLTRGPDGSVTLETAAGRRLTLARGDVASATPVAASVMPDGLAEILAIEDFRDLLAYLESLLAPANAPKPHQGNTP